MTMKSYGSEKLGRACPQAMAQIDAITGYITNIDNIRRTEYPTIQGTFLILATFAAACI
jgi:hypothetical protein